MNLLFASITTVLLVLRALSRKSLTPSGILAAVFTAAVHALHPWNLPFVLLITFYGVGTVATKVKHDVKAKLTVSSDGKSGGEGARNYVQVFANSLPASLLIILHAHQLGVFHPTHPQAAATACFSNHPNDLLIVGIITNYAATLSDTLSSELGILSSAPPRLITTLAPTPRGTNGGVTLYGLTTGFLGAALIGVVSVLLLPGCPAPPAAASSPWGLGEKVWFVLFVAALGTAGSLLDSLLGALFQQSVVDVRTRKIVEAPNGEKVLVRPREVRLSVQARVHSRVGAAPGSAREAVADVGGEQKEEKERGNSRVVITAQKYGVLSNNQVNLLMAAVMSAVGMVLWGGMGRVGVVLEEQVRTVVVAVLKQEFFGAVVGVFLG